MTLQDCLNLLAANPAIVLFYFSAIPLSAILAGELDRGEGHTSPWRFLYSILIYLVSIPGLFALVLTLYLLIFEGQSILAIDIYTQIVPIVSLLITLYVIRRNVDLDYIPGFDKLSGFLWIIFALMIMFWVIDKTRIVAISRFPFLYLVILFLGLVIAVLYGIRKMKRN